MRTATILRYERTAIGIDAIVAVAVVGVPGDDHRRISFGATPTPAEILRSVRALVVLLDSQDLSIKAAPVGPVDLTPEPPKPPTELDAAKQAYASAKADAADAAQYILDPADQVIVDKLAAVEAARDAVAVLIKAGVP